MTRLLWSAALVSLLVAGCGDDDAGDDDPQGARELAPLRIRNDRPIARIGELAYSAIPLGRDLDLRSVDELAVLDADGEPVAAQLMPLARWGSTAGDPDAAIEWLGVAITTDVAADGTAEYALWQLPGGADPAPDDVVAIAADGAGHVITTGVATFRIDPARPELITSIDLGDGEVHDGAAARRGPVVLDADGVELVARIDPGGFAIEEAGPVMVIVRTAGHFARAATGSACDADLAYTARLTFVRGRADIGLELELRNECGDAFQPGVTDPIPWWSQSYAISRAAWYVPLALGASAQAAAVTEQGVVRGPGAVARIEQLHGDVVIDGWRRAAITTGAGPRVDAAAFEQTLVALGDDRVTAAIAMPWMRYREPQALAADDGALAIELVSQPVAIGEAQARWHLAQIRFRRGALDDAALTAERDRAMVELERGLLVGTSVAQINASGAKPRLPEGPSPALDGYLERIEQVHTDTIATWQTSKKFGVTWPDTLDRDQYDAEQTSAAETPTGSNYWSASAAEATEYLRSGEPRWIWDVAYPLERTFLETILYDRGTLAGGDMRSGFHAGSSGASADQRTGRAFRTGYESDDYTYDQGSDEVYLARPTGATLERFAQACRTAIRRYPTEAEQAESSRDFYLNARTISRGSVQRWNLLAYAAKFVRDPALATACQERLHDVVGELIRDNVFAGIACEPETGNDAECTTPQNFMYTALIHDFFDSYARHYGTGASADGARAVVVTMGAQYDQAMIPRRGDGSIDVDGEWHKLLRCRFAAGALVGCDGIDAEEPSYGFERPGHLGVILVADALAPTGDCERVATALDAAIAGGSWESVLFPPDIGWWKGASQSFHNVLYGIGAAEACRAGD